MVFRNKFYKLLFLIIVTSCSYFSFNPPVEEQPQMHQKFSSGEIILANELLNYIFDQQMAPIECVPNTDEAGLLLRTLRPRIELVQDDIEASLDDDKLVDKLVNTCHENCICHYVDDLLKEHQVVLTKEQTKSLNIKKSQKELSRCLNYAQSTFCQSELYKELNQEKKDFSFEEMP